MTECLNGLDWTVDIAPAQQQIRDAGWSPNSRHLCLDAMLVFVFPIAQNRHLTLYLACVVNSRFPSLRCESMSFNLPQCASANLTSFNMCLKSNPSTQTPQNDHQIISSHASSWPSVLHIAPLSHCSVQLH